MTGTPPLVAETLDNDLLSQLLSSVRLTGSVFLDGQFRAPFGVISPARWEETPGFSRLRHASVFHLVTEGGCTMRIHTGGAFELSEGDLVLLPFTAEHQFWSGEHSGFVFGPDIARDGPVPGVNVIDHGGSGQRFQRLIPLRGEACGECRPGGEEIAHGLTALPAFLREDLAVEFCNECVLLDRHLVRGGNGIRVCGVEQPGLGPFREQA